MTIRVLVVDDSGFFRRRVTDMINADPRMRVIGTASTGLEAIEQNESLQPDIITLDYEMPQMDGITALRNIMNRRPVPVLMFSSLTFEGARVTLDALDAGAVDFLPKNFDAVAKGTAEMRQVLAEKIIAVAGTAHPTASSNDAASESSPQPSTQTHQPAPEAPRQSATSTSVAPERKAAVAPKEAARTEPARPAKQQSSSPGASLSGIEVIIIGTSTGGPAALQTVLKALPANFSLPILVIQHMPASFTAAFAERLNKVSKVAVKEATEGDQLKPGQVLVAPGGMQLMLDKRGATGSVRIHESDERMNYRPSVDIALASAAKHFGKKALGIVMTGMGADGKEGARLLKSAGGHMWTQDEASCVIYGMPMAIVDAGYSDAVVNLRDLANEMERINR